jgi:hypothetical protein
VFIVSAGTTEAPKPAPSPSAGKITQRRRAFAWRREPPPSRSETARGEQLKTARGEQLKTARGEQLGYHDKGWCTFEYELFLAPGCTWWHLMAPDGT